jgi:hypothetical protein
MFQWGASSGLFCALVLGGLGPIQGQEKVQVRRVSTVIGGTVQIAGDVSVGRIEDMVISDRGCIE